MAGSVDERPVSRVLTYDEETPKAETKKIGTLLREYRTSSPRVANKLLLANTMFKRQKERLNLNNSYFDAMRDEYDTAKQDFEKARAACRRSTRRSDELNMRTLSYLQPPPDHSPKATKMKLWDFFRKYVHPGDPAGPVLAKKVIVQNTMLKREKARMDETYVPKWKYACRKMKYARMALENAEKRYFHSKRRCDELESTVCDIMHRPQQLEKELEIAELMGVPRHKLVFIGGCYNPRCAIGGCTTRGCTNSISC